MKYGINCSETVSGKPVAEDYVRLGRALEGFGFHSFWLGDHVVMPAKIDLEAYPYAARGFGSKASWPDPFVALSIVAGVTQKLRIGTGVCVAPYRQPLPLAQTIATLDLVSNGRFTFGVGVGWMQEEFAALGVPFGERGARTDDMLRLMKMIWQGTITDYASPYFGAPRASLGIFPTQKPHPPILVGGDSLPALRRAAAFGDGVQWSYKSPETLRALLTKLKPLMVAAGRDMKELQITIVGDLKGIVASATANPYEIAEHESLGVSEIIFLPNTYNIDAGLHECESLAKFLKL